MAGDVQGEGDYKSARVYDDKVSEHAKDKDKVKAEAEAARKAVEGPEGEELERAEEKGKKPARH